MKKFGLSDWANVAEIGAAAGVIISLIFVGLELQSNTDATQAATREAMNQKDLDFLALRLDSSVLAVASAKRQNNEGLSPLEESQLLQMEYINFVAFEHSYRQYQKGFLGSDDWLRHENIARAQIERSQYAQAMWLRKRDTFTPDFRALVDSFVAALPAK